MIDTQDSMLTRSMLTGLFIGIIDTLICLAYNIGYRDFFTGYLPSTLINVSSLIFGVNLLLLIVGIVYFLFTKVFGKRDYIFSAAFLLLIAFCIRQIMMGHRFSDRTENLEFRGLLLGVVLVLGISIVALPYLLRSKFFEKYVL
ncbi:MAG: hypothetical protein JST68_14295 [Bacteroidetes bacterium]|nr:hypothetical protein [Bacteroidota bacterium]